MPIKLYNAGENIRRKASKEAEKVFVMLTEAYVLGGKILDVKYKNAVVRTVRAAIKSSK
jgi:NOL1/NOP2/fmu family ribosome biogenesis protein